ncbi:MAG: PilZ domain-containing protein [Thermodesulfobacteriota bacterium]
MFWKKKKSSQPDDSFKIEFEESPRYYFRVRPAPDRPVYMQIGGRRHEVYDISAGGLAIWAPELQEGQKISGLLHLPEGERPVPLIMVVRNMGAEGLVGGQFAKIRDSDRELIHYYVLKRQKEEIAETRPSGCRPRE